MSGRASASLAETQRIELAVAVAIVLSPLTRWSLPALARVVGPVNRPDLARVVQSMRMSGRLSMTGWTLSPTMRAKAEGAIAAQVDAAFAHLPDAAVEDERNLDQDSVAAGSFDLSRSQASAVGVADSPAPVATADGVAHGPRAGATASPVPDATPAAAEGDCLSRSQASAVAAGEPILRQAQDERSLGAPVRPSVAAQVRAEADALAAARSAARKVTGTLHGGSMGFGARIQLIGMESGPGAAVAMLRDGGAGVGALREAWADDVRLLGRIAGATGERPLPVLVRLIREEAARLNLRRGVGGVRRSLRQAEDDRDFGDDDDEAVIDEALRGGDAGPVDVLDEGNWQ